MRSAFRLGLRRFENRQHFRCFCGGCDMPFNQKVHEIRNDLFNLEVYAICIGEQAFVRGIVPNSSDRIPNRFFVSSKSKALNALIKIVAFSAEKIDKTLEANAEKSACSPRGRRGNRLGFDKGLPNVFRHVVRRFKPAPYRPNNASVLFKNKAATRRTAPDAEHSRVNKETLIGIGASKVAIANPIWPFDCYRTAIEKEMVNDGVLCEQARFAAMRAFH